jgi:hypothetical protein
VPRLTVGRPNTFAVRMSSLGERPPPIRPKLAWRIGTVILALALVAFGNALAAYVIAAMLGIFAVYAWTTRVDVTEDVVEKRPWGIRSERVARPVHDLEYIRVSGIARRAIEIGPMGSSVVLELGFWTTRMLKPVVRALMAEASELGDDDSRRRLERYAHDPET